MGQQSGLTEGVVRRQLVEGVRHGLANEDGHYRQRQEGEKKEPDGQLPDNGAFKPTDLHVLTLQPAIRRLCAPANSLRDFTIEAGGAFWAMRQRPAL